MREFIMSVTASAAFAALVMLIVQCMTDGAAGGIPEEEAEDENIN